MIGPPRWVESYLSIPFKRKGLDRNGCDCSGLVRLVLIEKCGIEVPDYGWVDASAHRAISEALRQALVDDVWVPVPIEEAAPFDLVPMSGLVRRQDGSVEVAEEHIGIMVSTSHVLHTVTTAGPSCVELRSLQRRLMPQADPRLRRHYSRCRN